MNKVHISDFIDQIGDGIHGTPVYSNGGTYYFINGNNLRDGQIIIDEGTLRISEEEFQKIKRPLSNNTILISINGTIGRLALYAGEKVALGKSACYINIRETECKHYIRYVLSTKEFYKYALQVAHGSTIKNLAPEQIAEYCFIAPEKEDQEKIASALKCLDDKITINKQICSELEAMAKTLYDYWFVQFDFPDENGRPYRSSGGEMVWNEQLKREIPKGWTVGKLCDIANITMGQSPAGESYNEMGEGTIFYQGRTDFGLRFPTPRMYTTAPTRFAKKGDILLSVRAPVGDLNLAMEPCCIGRGLAALNSKIGSQMHLFYTLSGFKQTFDIMDGNGTTFGSITKDILFDMSVVIPTNPLLCEFEKHIKPIETKIQVCEQENRELTKLRDCLLPMLMNGQARVE